MEYQFTFQGIGFAIIFACAYMAYRTKDLRWLIPIILAVLSIMFWQPFKHKMPDIGTVDIRDDRPVALPEAIESVDYDVDAMRKDLIKQSKEEIQ